MSTSIVEWPRYGAEGRYEMIWKSAIMGRTTTLTSKACDNYRLDRSTSPDCQLHELAAGGRGVAACAALGLMNSAREAGFYTEVFSCRSVYREMSFVVAVYDRQGGATLAFFTVMPLAISRQTSVGIQRFWSQSRIAGADTLKGCWTGILVQQPRPNLADRSQR